MEAALTQSALETAPRRRRRSAARWTLALIFAWSAGGKILWPAQFRAMLDSLGLIPEPWLAPLQYGLAPLELALAAAFALDWLRFPAALLATFLALTFTGVHSTVIATGSATPCGCAGVMFTQANRETHIAFLIVAVLMLGSALSLLLARPPADARAAAS